VGHHPGLGRTILAQLLDAAELAGRVARIFETPDAPAGDARIDSEHLVEPNLKGVHLHGVIRVPTDVVGIKAGRTNPRRKLEVVEDHRGQVVIDGEYGLGQLAAYRANELVIERGTGHGLAAVALRRPTRCGAMAHYMIRTRAAGLIGIAIANAGMGMAPTGGAKRIIGNNPFAMARGKGYDTRDCVAGMRDRGLTPDVARNTSKRRSAIDGRKALEGRRPVPIVIGCTPRPRQ
jgi:LDH2 family malate/lactate/ureidoglycolate dehydrogenase